MLYLIRLRLVQLLIRQLLVQVNDLALNSRLRIIDDDAYHGRHQVILLSGVPDYFGRNKISSGGDLSHYSSASLY